MFKSLVCLSTMSLPAFCLLLTACTDTTLGTRSFEENLDPFTIPGIPFSLGVLELPAVNIPLDLKDQPGYSSLDIVTSVHVRSAIFMISPDSDNADLDQLADNNPDNFDFLSSIVVSLKATIDGATVTQQVASLPEGDPQIGSNATVLSLVIDDVDIRDFVEAADVELVVEALGTNPFDFVVIDPIIRFRVGVGVR